MEWKTRRAAPRQLALALETPVLRGLGKAERARAVDLLAQLLLEASGLVDEENDAGVVCYGAPLLAGGYPLAAVSVSVPRVRLSEEVAAKLVASLCEVAGEAERQFEALA